MKKRYLQSLATAFALLAAAAPALAAAPDRRIVAVGDLHGDYAAWRAIARAAGLEDAAGRWTGGRTILVQTGDVVDRGPDSLRIILDLMRLQREASRAGGEVVALVGNHEAMNVTDDLRYVSASDYAAFADGGSAVRRDRVFAANKASIVVAYRKRDPAMTDDAVHAAWVAATPLGQIEHQNAWHPGGSIGRWIVANPAIVLINGTLFVHGGISVQYAKLPIDAINRQVDTALKNGDARPDAIINDANGPLWYRGLATQRPAELKDRAPPDATDAPIEAELDQVLEAYGAKRLVNRTHPRADGDRGPVRWPAGSYRHRYLRRFRRDGRLSRNPGRGARAARRRPALTAREGEKKCA